MEEENEISPLCFYFALGDERSNLRDGKDFVNPVQF